MLLSKIKEVNSMKDHREGVRKILLKGIFWRILIIESILLVWSLLYRALYGSSCSACGPVLVCRKDYPAGCHHYSFCHGDLSKVSE